MNTKKYLINPEDMPVIANRLKETLERDINEFREISSHFNRKFLTAFDQLISQAEPEEETSHNDAANLQRSIEQLLLQINECLETQAVDVEEELADALIKIAVEEALEKKVAAIHQLVALLERNEYLFAEESLDPAWFVDLRSLAASFGTKTTPNATPLNKGLVYDQLWDCMQQICVAGQALYKHTDAGRARQYSFKCLKEKWLQPANSAHAA